MNKATKSGIICIKIGGNALLDEGSLKTLITDMSEIGKPVVLVHGGGSEVSRISALFGLKPNFSDGIRITSKEEMEVVDMVLSGKLNTYLVRLFHAAGIKAVGLTGCDGALFQGTRMQSDSRTGHIQSVDATLLSILLNNGYVPVIASTSVEADGTALNINADEAALAIASAVYAETLVFLSDIPGILVGGERIPSMSRADIRSAINNGSITGGMIPKVLSSVSALESGVGNIIIGQYEKPGDLHRLLSRESGTDIIH